MKVYWLIIIYTDPAFLSLTHRHTDTHTHTHTHTHTLVYCCNVGVDRSVTLSHSSHRCPGIPQLAANEGDVPGLVTWIICHRRLGGDVALYPAPPPSAPSSTLIHPCEAFTHSLRFWSAVCQRLFPLKRRWQPLIITQAERRAFLSAEILVHTDTHTHTRTHVLISPLRPHTKAEAHHLASIGLHHIWQMSWNVLSSGVFQSPSSLAERVLWAGTSRQRWGCNDQATCPGRPSNLKHTHTHNAGGELPVCLLYPILWDDFMMICTDTDFWWKTRWGFEQFIRAQQ